MHNATPTNSALALRRIVRCDPGQAAEIGADDFVFDAPGVEAVAAACAAVILADSDAARAATLLASGAPCVLIGQAALEDSMIVEPLVAAYGANRIGIYAPAQRQAVSWSFETLSNADFKTVAPSCGEPAWDVLQADGTPTGTLVAWWLGAMRARGASLFLVRADIRDDADLNICAGLVEDLGAALWIGPRTDAEPRLDEWIAYGQCRQLALPPELFARHTST